MGWLVLDVRLRREGRPQEGGSVSRRLPVCPLPLYTTFFRKFSVSILSRKKGALILHHNSYNAIIAGFFTGGSLAIRGGYKAARNGAIGCAVLLAVIEGVGIGFQRMLAGSTKLEVRVSRLLTSSSLLSIYLSGVACHNANWRNRCPHRLKTKRSHRS